MDTSLDWCVLAAVLHKRYAQPGLLMSYSCQVLTVCCVQSRVIHDGGYKEA